MKRILIGMLVLCCLFYASAWAANLFPGTTGDEVVRLQNRLTELQFFFGEADGIYGDRTRKAVSAFQAAMTEHGTPLSVDGIAGQQTLSVLYNDEAIAPLLQLKVGSTGKAVRELQTLLYDLNYLQGKIDGRFGNQTKQALERLQEDLKRGGAAGVEPNGIYDCNTRRVLQNDVTPYGIQAPETFDDTKPLTLTNRHLYARAAYLIDAATGQVLFAHNEQKRMYPASTTKIMTLLCALDALPLERIVTVPKEAAEVPKDSSLTPIYSGEKLTVADLMYSLMIRSGNDAANALAKLSSGSVERFVAMMNNKAQTLGLKNTHYVNAHGYHHPDHATTAEDLGKLAKVALEKGDFVNITMTMEHSLPPYGEQPPRDLQNTWELLIEGESMYYPYAFGIKSGFTKAAGFCFVGAARKDDKTLIAVALNTRIRSMCWQDMRRLFEYGFAK